MTIRIDWVEPDIEVRVDMSKLTWGDVLELQRAQTEGEGDAETRTMEAIQKVVTKVTGVEALDLPAQAFRSVLEAIMERANGDGGTPAKN